MKIQLGRGGFTLVELLAVMAIIGVLAAIVVPAVSGFGETSREAQGQQDATSIDTATVSYFQDQPAGEVLTREEVSLTTEVSGSAVTSTTQTISSRWPEKFITAEDGNTATAIYVNEFTTEGTEPFSSTVTNVIVKDEGGATINGETLLTQYTAVDFDTLAEESYVQKKPNSADSLAFDRFHNFLWLMRKQTSPESGTSNDSRKLAVFRLVSVVITDGESGTEPGGTLPPSSPTGDLVELTYEQIF